MQERLIGLQTEQEAANRFEVRGASLELLGDGVDVTEPALERLVGEDRM